MSRMGQHRRLGRIWTRNAIGEAPCLEYLESRLGGVFKIDRQRPFALTDGKAGTVENVWLDELHGFRISIKGHDGRWPVSTIKFTENSELRIGCALPSARDSFRSFASPSEKSGSSVQRTKKKIFSVHSQAHTEAKWLAS